MQKIDGIGSLPGFTVLNRDERYITGYIEGDWATLEEFIKLYQTVTGLQYSRIKKHPVDFGDRGKKRKISQL